MILTVFLIALIFISLYQCKCAPKGTFTSDYLGRNQSKMLRAIACLGVIVHHITQSVTSYGVVNKGPITILSSMGILFTSVFFFFSGYGLIINVIDRADYLEGFLTHRLSVILIPFFTSNVIYTLSRVFISHIPLSGAAIIKCILGLELINGNGWYIVEIFFLYVFFYVIFRIIRQKDVAIILLCIVTLGIMMIGYRSGHDLQSLAKHWFRGEWWYNATITFMVGMLYARFRRPIEEFIHRHYRILIVLIPVLFIVSFGIEEKILARYGYYISVSLAKGINGQMVTLIAQMVTCVLFVITVTVICAKITFGNRIIRYVSSVSIEVFLIHGLFLDMLEDNHRIPDYMLYILVPVLGILAASVLHIIDVRIINLIQKLGKKKSYLDECEKDLIREKKEYNVKLTKKIVLAVFILGAVLLGIGKLYYQFVKLPAECRKEIAAIKKAEVGDVVRFGRYETNYNIPGNERVDWVLLYRTEDAALLVTQKGIDGSVYNHKYEEITWKTSDLCNYLNTDMYDKLFSAAEKLYIVPNPDTGDNVSLLSVHEAEQLFENDKERELDVTEAARKRGVYVNEKSKVNKWDSKGYRSSWWWLRGEETPEYQAPIVSVDGVIQIKERHANKPNGAVRPVVWVRINETGNNR